MSLKCDSIVCDDGAIAGKSNTGVASPSGQVPACVNSSAVEFTSCLLSATKTKTSIGDFAVCFGDRSGRERIRMYTGTAICLEVATGLTQDS